MKRKDVLSAATLGTEDFDALKVEVTASLREGVLPVPGSIHHGDMIVPEEDAAGLWPNVSGLTPLRFLRPEIEITDVVLPWQPVDEIEAGQISRNIYERKESDYHRRRARRLDRSL